MISRISFLPAAVAVVALFSTACSDAATSPMAVAAPSTARMSGGSGGGGGSVTGGGGSTAVIPQVAGTWTGTQTFDPSLSAFFLPGFMVIPASITLIEDAAGNITGTDNIMHQPITGKASGNGSIVLQDGSYYGTRKMSMNITGSVVCADGSTSAVLTGKFQQKEGFGVISVDSCPIL